MHFVDNVDKRNVANSFFVLNNFSCHMRFVNNVDKTHVANSFLCSEYFILIQNENTPATLEVDICEHKIFLLTILRQRLVPSLSGVMCHGFGAVVEMSYFIH